MEFRLQDSGVTGQSTSDGKAFANFPREETYDELFKPACSETEGETLDETPERIRESLAVHAISYRQGGRRSDLD